MDLTSSATIKGLLQKYQVKPSKGMGQNFLIDKKVLAAILEASALSKEDIVVEVGPGIGTLTQALAPLVKKVIAIEKDAMMVEILKETLAGFDNVEVIHGDILKIDNLGFGKNYKVVANIPYYLTSPLIRQFLESGLQPESLTLMMQKEVAQRICAKPGDMSVLAVSVQYYADAKIITHASKTCFWPSPKVDSAVIHITPKKSTQTIDSKLFFRVVKAGFSHPRKQLLNNLSSALKKDRQATVAWLSQSSIEPTQRAETLSVGDWVKLVDSLG